MNLKSHYDNMWQDTLQQYQKGNFEYDHRIGSTNDDRFGITLLTRPNENITTAIKNIMEPIVSLTPHQYYYPDTDIHITVMSIISCYSGFTLDQINMQAYREVVANSLVGVKPFSINLHGITISPSSILIQGFPSNDDLKKIRDNLRLNFKHSPLKQSIDIRYELKTAHITAARFSNKIKDPTALIKLLKKIRHSPIGSFEVQQLELVFNDWYQRKKNTYLINKFALDYPPSAAGT